MAKRKIRIPTKQISELVVALLASGASRSEIPAIVGRFADDLVDFREVVKGPVGVALEFIDGPVYTAAAGVIVALLPRKDDEPAEG